MSIQKIKSKLLELRGQKIPLAADIEGFCGNVTCISFAPSPDVAYVIPFAHADGTSVWTEDEEVELWQAVKELLEDPEVPKIGQNFLFDTFALAWTYGICTRNIYHDTMLGMFECFAELQKGLATQASLLTKEPFYKPDKTEEGELKFDSDEEFWHYNGLDSCVTYECYLKQMELLDEGQKAHLRFNVELLPALLFMQIRGMKWDSEAASLARQEALQKAFELQARIDEEAHRKAELKCGKLVDQDALRVAVGIDKNCLTKRAELNEALFAGIVSRYLCQKNIKRPVEKVEERWQPMKWNGKKWVKSGKVFDEFDGDSMIILPRACVESNTFLEVEEDWIAVATKEKTKTKNQPFTPLTLDECEEFVLESCRAEWQRVKEIWSELKTYAKNQSGENQRSICGDAAVEAGRLSQRASESHEIESAESGSSESGARPAQDTESGRSSSSALLGELSTILGLSINVGSTQSDGDAQRFLYEICGFKPQFKKAKGKRTEKISSDQSALVTLYASTKDVRVLWVLQLRRLRKMCSDLALEVDEDGRLRSTFSLVKETGRMAASESPTGKGTNAQALNRDLRYLVKADEGFEMRKRDLEGADNWTTALECAKCGDTTMIDDLKAGIKPAQALCVVFDNPEAFSWDRAAIKAYWKENKKAFEAWKYPAFKKVIHGTSYGMGIPTMILNILKESLADLPMDLATAQPVVVSRHEAEAFRATVLRRYPGLLKWQAKCAKNLCEGKGEIRTFAGHVRRFYGRKHEIKNGVRVANHDTLKEYLASLPQWVTTYATKAALHRMWHDTENNPGDGTLKAIPAYVVHDSLDSMNRLEDSAWCNAKEKEWFNNEIEVSGLKAVIPSEGARGKDWSMK